MISKYADLFETILYEHNNNLFYQQCFLDISTVKKYN